MEIAPASEKLFNIIIKLTSHCCLACDYCYIGPHQSQYGAKVMSLKMIEKALNDFLELVKDDRGADIDSKTIKLTWHGGEPLLAGLSYFKEIIDLEKSVIPSSFRVTNAITSNGVKFDKDWVDFFKKENFQIGISIDGPQHVHDLHRKTKKGEGSFRQVMSTIKMLKEANIQFGALSVISSESAKNPDYLFKFFIEEDIKNLNFIPYTTFSEWLSPKEYTKFSIRFFDLWYELDDPGFYIRDFANIIARIFGRDSNLCEYTNCFGNYLGLDTNGDIYMCDLLIGQSEFLLGNIQNISLGKAIESKRYTDLKSKARINAPSCNNCQYFLVCTGGCMYRRYLKNSILPGKDIYCSTRSSLITHIAQTLDKSYCDQKTRKAINASSVKSVGKN